MTDLAYQDFGPRDARPVVFTGSIASSTDMWLPQLDALAGGFRVIAVDHPGHGRSPLSAGGHVPTVEVPDEVTGVLRDFLSR